MFARLQGFSRSRDVPALREEFLDGEFLNAFLHPQLVVQKMIGNKSSISVYAVDADAITIPVGAD